MFTKAGEGKSRELAKGIVLTTTVYGDKSLMAHFQIKKGAKIPVHAHPHEQTGMMISGKLRFNVEGELKDVGPGDSWCLKGDVPHSAEALEDSVIVEIFTPIREDYR